MKCKHAFKETCVLTQEQIEKLLQMLDEYEGIIARVNAKLEALDGIIISVTSDSEILKQIKSLREAVKQTQKAKVDSNVFNIFVKRLQSQISHITKGEGGSNGGTPSVVDLSEIMTRLAETERMIVALNGAIGTIPPAVDLSGIETRLAALESKEIPPVDLSGIETRLTALEHKEIPTVDLSLIETRLTALENMEIPTVDLSGVELRLTALENRQCPSVDLTGITERLSSLEETVEDLWYIHNPNGD